METYRLYRFLRSGSESPKRGGDVEVVQPVVMACSFVKTMGGALVTGPASRLGINRPKVHQHRPATQPELRRVQVPMPGAGGGQRPIQVVPGTVHLVACAGAPRMTGTENIRLGPTPKLFQRLVHRARPPAGRSPLTKRLHRPTEGLSTCRLVHLPTRAMKLDGLAAGCDPKKRLCGSTLRSFLRCWLR